MLIAQPRSNLTMVPTVQTRTKTKKSLARSGLTMRDLLLKGILGKVSAYDHSQIHEICGLLEQVLSTPMRTVRRPSGEWDRRFIRRLISRSQSSILDCWGRTIKG